MLWTVDGGVILWIGYWLFVVWIVWSYERRVSWLRAENEKLRRALERKNLGENEKRKGGYLDPKRGQKV